MADLRLMPDRSGVPAGLPAVMTTRLFVRGMSVMASIGVHAHERRAPQQLVIDVEMDVPAIAADRLEHSFDYARVGDAVWSVIDEGHVDLVESFAERVAHRLFAVGRIDRLMIRVTKPAALKPDAACAGVELYLRRG